MADDAAARTVVGATADRNRVDRWALVLASQGLSSAIVPADAGWALIVDAPDGPAAAAALGAYESENPPVPEHTAAPPSIGPAGVAAALFCAYLLAGAYRTLDGSGAPAEQWVQSAANVAGGGWWRMVTSLGVHAGLGHLLANLAAGSLFVGLTGARIGPGVAVLLVLAGGALGNAASSALQRDVTSIGASTAVFAAVGILAGLRFRRPPVRGEAPWRRALLAGLALLALLGSSRESDVVAHLTGFAAGVPLGVVALWLKLDERRAAASAVLQLVAAGLAAWLALYAWSHVA
jgi:membrane associated rhomboid family serine protease